MVFLGKKRRPCATLLISNFEGFIFILLFDLNSAANPKYRTGTLCGYILSIVWVFGIRTTIYQ